MSLGTNRCAMLSGIIVRSNVRLECVMENVRLGILQFGQVSGTHCHVRALYVWWVDKSTLPVAAKVWCFWPLFKSESPSKPLESGVAGVAGAPQKISRMTSFVLNVKRESRSASRARSASSQGKTSFKSRQDAKMKHCSWMKLQTKCLQLCHRAFKIWTPSYVLNLCSKILLPCRGIKQFFGKIICLHLHHLA